MPFFLMHEICKIHRLHWIIHHEKGVFYSTFVFFFFICSSFFIMNSRWKKKNATILCRVGTQKTCEKWFIHIPAGLKEILCGYCVFFFALLILLHFVASLLVFLLALSSLVGEYSLHFIIISLFCQNKQIGVVFLFFMQCH